MDDREQDKRKNLRDGLGAPEFPQGQGEGCKQQHRPEMQKRFDAIRVILLQEQRGQSPEEWQRKKDGGDPAGGATGDGRQEKKRQAGGEDQQAPQDGRALVDAEHGDDTPAGGARPRTEPSSGDSWRLRRCTG